MNTDQEGARPDAASSGPEAIAIHTMQDDLAQARRQPSPARPAAGASSPSAAAPGAVTRTSQQLPLPPKAAPATDGQKVLVEPRRPRRRRISRLLLVVVPLLLLVLAGSGLAAWQWLGLGSGFLPGFSDQTPEAAVTALDILPADPAIVIQYQLSAGAARSAVISAWERAAVGTGAGPATALLNGDPRPLITQFASITELYYVLLPGETRPYLVVPKNADTTSFLTNNPDLVLAEHSGWYIAHPVSTEAYEAALVAGTLAARTKPVLTGTDASPIRLLVGPAFIREARRIIGGQRLLEGTLQELVLASSPDGLGTALQLSGQATAVGSFANSQVADQQLLALVPGTAQFVHLGGNFSQDAKSWAQLGSLPDAAAIAGLPLLDQLSTPYAFYRDTSVPTNEAYGLIIKRSSALAGMQAGDPALVSALSQLKQFVTGQRILAPIEFNSVDVGGISLNYANLSGPTQAIDYALTDQYLLIATSKDAMTALLNTVSSSAPSLADTAPYQNLLSAWGALPPAPQVMLAAADLPLLRSLLPATATPTPLGLAFTHPPGSNELTVTGVLTLSDTR